MDSNSKLLDDGIGVLLSGSLATQIPCDCLALSDGLENKK
jgi:hypothetical protein